MTARAAAREQDRTRGTASRHSETPSLACVTSTALASGPGVSTPTLELPVDFFAARNGEQEPHRRRAHEQGRSAKAHERERQALGREDRHRHRQIHERLRAEQHRDAERDVRAVLVLGVERRAHAARHDQHVHGAQRQNSEKSELFTDDGRDEVGVRFREVEDLQSPTEAEADGAPGAEAHHRLKRLVSQILAVLGHVEPGEHALPAISRETHRPDGEQRAQHAGAEQVAEPSARDEQKRERQKQEHDGATEVRLLQAQHHQKAGHQKVRQHPDREALHALALLFERVGEPQDERDLRGLGGLNVDRSDRQPARRAAAAVTEADHAQDHEHRDDTEDRVRVGLEPVVLDARSREHDEQAADRVNRLPNQEILWIAEGRRRFDDARRVDHDDAEAEEGDGGGREHGIERALTAFERGRGSNRSHRETSERRRPNASTKRSPRSA